MNVNELDVEYILKTFSAKQKVNAIKYVRDMTGIDLKSAKDFIDNLYSENHDKISELDAASVFYNKIKALPGADTYGTKKEIKYLQTIMLEGEEVKAVSSGLMNGNTWLMASTNKRVILIDCGMIIGKKQMEIPLNQINAISFKTGIFLSKIIISHGSGSMTMENVRKGSERFFVDATNKAMREYGTPVQQVVVKTEMTQFSVADEIIKLKNLLDCGALTQEEFDTQKKKLLG